jgi:hypothetical protein
MLWCKGAYKGHRPVRAGEEEFKGEVEYDESGAREMPVRVEARDDGFFDDVVVHVQPGHLESLSCLHADPSDTEFAQGEGFDGIGMLHVEDEVVYFDCLSTRVGRWLNARWQLDRTGVKVELRVQAGLYNTIPRPNVSLALPNDYAPLLAITQDC